jgi:rod shape-determining protein MreC
LKRPTYIAACLVLALTLIVLNLPNHTRARLKLGIGGLFLPLLGLAGTSQQLTGAALDRVMPRRELLRQNEALRQENQELHLKANHTEAVERENARLRQMLGWRAQQSLKFKLARVVLRDPSNWWRTLQIDLGSRDGLPINAAVLSAEGALVGRVSAVGLATSQVVLLGDPACHVGAVVENATRDTGVIGASGSPDSGLVELGRLSSNADLKPGQLVRTSGLEGSLFPKDILIGQIVDAQLEYGYGTVARVRLAVDLDALEEVWVVMQR